MADRRSDDADKPEQANYSIKITLKDMEQLSSSAAAVKINRNKKAIDALVSSVQRFKEGEGSVQRKDDPQGQQPSPR